MTEGSKRKSTDKMSAKEREARKKRKIIIFAVEIIVILAMLVALYFVMQLNDEGPKVTDLQQENLEIPEQVIEQKEEGGTMHGYKNIALFGVDAQNDKQLLKGSRSDSIMIASINMDTGDIKLVSVYRDTYLNIGNDEYIKCNHAYSHGGAEQAVRMLNMNLDMDIEDFVTVGYQGMVDVVDGLGGVYVDVDEEEVKWINYYQVNLAEVLQVAYEPVEEAGYQLLDGLQATAYCRIRYTAGDDFKRASRQREVLKAIEEQAKKTDLTTLTKVFNEAIDDIYTSLDTKTIMELIEHIADYQITEEGGFPDASMRTVANIGSKGSSVIPMDLESNVVWLHQFLFEDVNYQVSDNVREYGEQIEEDTTPYINKNN